MPPFPEIEPYDSGLLDVGDGNLVYYEQCGSRRGKPALVVHGGPGSGCTSGHRRSFDPTRYRIVLFDQRGCGRSAPHASDPGVDMSANTTPHLVRDMEQLREHLHVDRWLLYGGSWGSTLSLAYAEQHPRHVSEIVLVDVTSGRRREYDWLYRGVARFFPHEWREFLAAADCPPDGDIGGSYARLLADPDRGVRERAAIAWMTWEDTVVSLEPSGPAEFYRDQPMDAMLAFVRICAHYYAHYAWLEDGVLIRDAHRLRGIPGVLVHGRFDLSSPIESAWELTQAWTDARLQVVGDSGHKGSETMREAVLTALAGFAE